MMDTVQDGMPSRRTQSVRRRAARDLVSGGVLRWVMIPLILVRYRYLLMCSDILVHSEIFASLVVIGGDLCTTYIFKIFQPAERSHDYLRDASNVGVGHKAF